ncbi:hypothetical protein QAD02_020132 [Eretmocerus hayati]|uniref:Uncharacterized protein n=1 Tax=Eretmocerus hayati TaxID=131215 RepID=A0ACC2PL88_9HYME|nr:hypothetical protein QAD02_020132 [Eretmocerus hayati]
MRSVLGKYGLWPLDQNKYLADYDPSNNWAGQQVLQSNLHQYQYFDPLTGPYEAYKQPNVVKVLSGYVPAEPMPFKSNIDRKFRTDGKVQKLSYKGQNSPNAKGKYICYWTNENAGLKVQSQPNAFSKQEFSTRRPTGIADEPEFYPYNKRRQLDRYKEYDNVIHPSISDVLLAPGYQNQRYLMDSKSTYDDALAYQQQMNFQSSVMEHNDNTLERGGSSFSFASSGNQVLQNNQGAMNTQQPIEYLIKDVDAVTATMGMGNIEPGN